eukprot:gene12801-15022_t
MSEKQPLLSTYGDISLFEKLIKEIGTARDTNTFRSGVHKKKVDIAENLKTISSRLKASSTGVSKIQREKMVKDLKEAATRFDVLIHQATSKEAAHKPINDPESIEQHRNSYRESQFGSKERNKAAKQLVDDMRVLQEVVGDIAALVGEQGEQLKVADTNVATADINVEEAVVELEKAYVYKSSYRKKLFFLLLCLGITVVGVAIFLGVWFGVLKR